MFDTCAKKIFRVFSDRIVMSFSIPSSCVIFDQLKLPAAIVQSPGPSPNRSMINFQLLIGQLKF